ncbi:hypothetical protein ACVWZA_002504 [Sphingomonas sp. UYAg733]
MFFAPKLYIGTVVKTRRSCLNKPLRLVPYQPGMLRDK